MSYNYQNLTLHHSFYTLHMPILAYESLTMETFQDLLKSALWIVPMSGTTDDFPPVGSLTELPLELRELLITILVLIYNNICIFEGGLGEVSDYK